MKKGQAGSKEKYSCWIGQYSQKEQIRQKKASLVVEKGKVVVQRKTTEKDWGERREAPTQEVW